MLRRATSPVKLSGVLTLIFAFSANDTISHMESVSPSPSAAPKSIPVFIPCAAS